MINSLPISVCMIVKNEENFLASALESVRAVLSPDEIIVADTGSTDKTKEIASENGAIVVDFPWCDDFSAARNFSAVNASRDWILVLDADEEIISADTQDLLAFLRDERSVGAVTMIEIASRTSSPLSRLYNRKHYVYSGIIHEQLVPVDNLRKKIIKEAPIHIVHHGYAPEIKESKGKLERNEKLLLKELAGNPNDPYLLYQLGKCYFDASRDLQKASEAFEKALAAMPDYRLEYVYHLVECYGYTLLKTDRYSDALEFINGYYDRYGDKPQFRFLAAHVFQNNGMFIEAVEQYESCIDANITDYSGITSYLAYYNIGVVLECVGMLEDAIEMYKNCGDYEPAVERLLCLTL